MLSPNQYQQQQVLRHSWASRPLHPLLQVLVVVVVLLPLTTTQGLQTALHHRGTPPQPKQASQNRRPWQMRQQLYNNSSLQALLGQAQVLATQQPLHRHSLALHCPTLLHPMQSSSPWPAVDRGLLTHHRYDICVTFVMCAVLLLHGEWPV
jgi:hypothetical protein